MRILSDENCREIQNTFYFSKFLFENHALYEVMWKSILQPDTPQMTRWGMRIACWIPKATKTLSKYVILIAFPRQQWLCERTSLLRYSYNASFVTICCNLRFCLPSLFFSKLYYQNPVWISFTARICYIPFPSYPPQFDLPNNIWWRVEIRAVACENTASRYEGSIEHIQ